VNASDGNSWTNDTFWFKTEKKSSSGGSSSGGGGSIPPSIEEDVDQNIPPEIPAKPSGQILIESGLKYNFTTSTFDLDNDKIRYRFDWGDGYYSNWTEFVLSNTSVSINYSWDQNSIFDVKAIAQDENGINSSWSLSLTITVSQSEHMVESIQDIYDVALSNLSSSNKSVHFNFSEISVLDDAVSYFWDFGDGSNGTGINPNHEYNDSGKYNVTLFVTDDMGTTHTKSFVVTVNSDASKQIQEEKQDMFSFGYFTIIFLILSICLLILFFKDRITIFLLQNRVIGFSENKMVYFNSLGVNDIINKNNYNDILNFGSDIEVNMSKQSDDNNLFKNELEPKENPQFFDNILPVKHSENIQFSKDLDDGFVVENTIESLDFKDNDKKDRLVDSIDDIEKKVDQLFK